MTQRTSIKSEDETKHIPMDLIARSPYQPRRDFKPTELRELAQSIDEQGLLQAILIRPLQNGRFELIAGERRYRAHEINRADTILCRIKKMTNLEAQIACMVENLQRQDLNPVEEALGFADMVELGHTHEVISKMVAKSRSQITNSLRLLKLPEEILDLIRNAHLDRGHAKLLIGLERFQQINLGRQAADQCWSVKKLEKKVAAAKTISFDAGVAPAGKDVDLARLERSLSDHFGSPCKVRKRRGGSGELVIGFASSDVLEGVFKKMGFTAEI
ncbi:ParB/RepB/Spo0J family partition protein [Porticoccaceae bacterium]|nr:ParB/RepB/Spo0J family partition protein [Porticoccaceae bacterium]